MVAIFPKTRGEWIRCGVIVVILIAACCYRNIFSLWQLVSYRPAEGDIVFQSLPHGELVDAIEGVTESPWSHCGVVVSEHGLWYVVEAIGEVRKTPLPLWIIRGRNHGYFEAYRPKAAFPAGPKTLPAALDHYLGRPYDFHYAPGDNAIYCSELVFDGYRDAYGVELGHSQLLGNLNWKPFEAFIRSLEGGNLPLDRPMITPVELTRSPLLSRIYPAKSKSTAE